MRYGEFCSLSRVAELLGERWTLLIVRELLVGPQRFTDLRRQLPGISPSILTERLNRLRTAGLVERTLLEPPAASAVYLLTPDGSAIRPAIYELIRWGTRFLYPAHPDEMVEPSWVQLTLEACALRAQSPARTYLIEVRGDTRRVVLLVRGGQHGTTVVRLDPVAPRPDADAALTARPRTVLDLAFGTIDPDTAVESGTLHVDGNVGTVRFFPSLFEVNLARQDR